MARIFSYAFTTAKNSDEHDLDGGGGPYAAQHIGGFANIGGGDTNLFSEITSKGLQTGLGSIAGLGYGASEPQIPITFLNKIRTTHEQIVRAVRFVVFSFSVES
jgi:26S proteasome regulatory subunit T1